MSRRELQSIAKAMEVRANQKSTEIISAIEAIWKSEDCNSNGCHRSSSSDSSSSDSSSSTTTTTTSNDGCITRGSGSGSGSRIKSTSSSPRTAAEKSAADSDVDGRVIGLDLIERELPSMLIPARCEAGRWQPFTLVGQDVALTMMVRHTDTAPTATAPQSFPLPPLKIGAERHTSLRLQRRPVEDLSEARVRACVEYTSLVLGVLGVGDETLFPRALSTVLAAPSGAETLSGVGMDGSRDDAHGHDVGCSARAAILFQPPGDPSDDDVQRAVDALSEPSRWPTICGGSEHVDDAGACRGKGEPAAESSRQNLCDAVLLGAGQSRQYFRTAHLHNSAGELTAKISRGASALAQFASNDHNRVEGVAERNPKTRLQEELQRCSMPCKALYTAEQLGEQLWAATVTIEGVGVPRGPFQGEAATRKRDSEKSAAVVALKALEEHLQRDSSLDEADGVPAKPADGAAHDEPPHEEEPHPRESLRRLVRPHGFPVYSIKELGQQLFEATVSLHGEETAGSETTDRRGGEEVVAQTTGTSGSKCHTPELRGPPARSKKLACYNAAVAALAEWEVEVDDDAAGGDAASERDGHPDDRGSSTLAATAFAAAAAAQDLGQTNRSTTPQMDDSAQMLLVPLGASQWRGASCGVVVARMLAHLVEVESLRDNLATQLRPQAVPSVPFLRAATTPQSVGGYRQSNEYHKWVGNAVLGMCAKIAAVISLGKAPGRARLIYDHASY
jgi:hypothetical protein